MSNIFPQFVYLTSPLFQFSNFRKFPSIKKLNILSWLEFEPTTFWFVDTPKITLQLFGSSCQYHNNINCNCNINNNNTGSDINNIINFFSVQFFNFSSKYGLGFFATCGASVDCLTDCLNISFRVSLQSRLNHMHRYNSDRVSYRPQESSHHKCLEVKIRLVFCPSHPLVENLVQIYFNIEITVQK